MAHEAKIVNINEAKKLVASVLEKEGIKYTKLTASTKSFGGLGYGSAIFVKPIGMALPDSRVKAVQDELRGSGVILHVPMIVAPGYIVS